MSKKVVSIQTAIVQKRQREERVHALSKELASYTFDVIADRQQFEYVAKNTHGRLLLYKGNCFPKPVRPPKKQELPSYAVTVCHETHGLVACIIVTHDWYKSHEVRSQDRFMQNIDDELTLVIQQYCEDRRIVVEQQPEGPAAV